MQLDRSIGLVGLTFIAVGGVLGSGWLFAPLLAVEYAGPAAVIAWFIGAIAMLLLAMTFGEVTAILPVAGGLARIPYFSHGNLVAMIMGWTAWIGYVVAAPIEVSVLLQYLAPAIPWAFYEPPDHGVLSLTLPGLGVASALLVLLTVLNAFGVALFARINTALTWAKIVLPIVIGITLIASRFETANFEAAGGFMPYGVEGVFSAVSVGGIIFAFIGFRHAIDMAGETRRPQVTIPLALILSLVICAAIYLLLQVAFIGALDDADLVHAWKSFDFTHRYGPMGALAQALAMIWLVQLIVGAAIVGPFGAALVSTGSDGRLVLALARNGFFAAIFTKLSRYGVPLNALILNTFAGVFALLVMPFHEIVAINSSSLTLALTTGPLALLALRYLAPDEKRWFRLPCAPLLAGLAFVIATLIIYWSGWDTLWRLGIALVVGLAIFAYRNRRNEWASLDFPGAAWLPPYVATIGVVSAFGTFGGGSGDIPFGWDVAILAVVAVALLVVAVRGRISRERYLQLRNQASSEGDATADGASNS